mmetsp:Transcript_19172/g.38512  ORF Transcript_19172/g.38512 Transcript_19172/m.38512 type:complete len:94 (+) Transcript_19172:1695-1976(+)
MEFSGNKGLKLQGMVYSQRGLLVSLSSIFRNGKEYTDQLNFSIRIIYDKPTYLESLSQKKEPFLFSQHKDHHLPIGTYNLTHGLTQSRRISSG